MNTTLTIWRMHLRSMRNAARYDQRMRVALGVGFVFNVIIGFWAASQLSLRIHEWQTQGPAAVEMGLWSLCWLTWGGISALTIIGSVQRALSDDEALLLLTLPVTPAARFRALYGSFFIENLWNWLLLEIGVTGYVLLSTTGGYALAWLILLQLGVGVSVLCTLIAALLLIRYLLPREQAKRRIAVALTLALASVVVTVFTLKGMISPRSLLLWLRPEFVIVLFVLLFLIVLGLLADATGRLYVAAFQITQGWNRSRKVLTLPGIRTLTGLLSRRRTFMSALLVKMLLSQSRNWIAWGRIGIVLIALVLLPQLHGVAAHYGWSDTLFVIGYASGAALLTVIEQAPGAISGEANRLSIYLSAPFTLSRLLWAKLILFLLPTLIFGLMIGLFLTWQLGLTPGQAGFALSVVALLIAGTLVVLVWGSAWDEDLSLTVEGAMQTILQEETPITPRRMLLLNLGVGFFVGMFLLLWKLPPLLALLALVLLDGSALALMWRFSRAHLLRLFRAG